MQQAQVVSHKDIVIVGGGIAGLTTALGLHRLGVRSLVLESSDCLRTSGFALNILTNGWRALDAVGVGNSLRQKSLRIRGFQVSSMASETSPKRAEIEGYFESRCLRRTRLLETLEKELPKGTIRYSSKVVSIEESGYFKLVHLADGSVVQAKTLIGCDGVNSIVAKWLGLQNPVHAGRLEIRGFVDYKISHEFEPLFYEYSHGCLRFGVLPCDSTSLYWFLNFTPSIFLYDENTRNPLELKQFVLAKICNIVSKEVYDIVEKTELKNISCAQLKFRLPWNVILGNITKSNVCVIGDALHPMTPDIGQGACSALEDSVILARYIAEVVSPKTRGNEEECEDKRYVEMERCLEKYARARRWRNFSLICVAYIVGFIQQSNGRIMRFLKEWFLSKYTVEATRRMANFDCGELASSSLL